MLDKEKKIVNQRLRLNIIQWKNQGIFYSLNYISDHVTLFQLIDSIVNVNHAVSIVGKWVFDSNFNKYLPLSV